MQHVSTACQVVYAKTACAANGACLPGMQQRVAMAMYAVLAFCRCSERLTRLLACSLGLLRSHRRFTSPGAGSAVNTRPRGTNDANAEQLNGPCACCAGAPAALARQQISWRRWEGRSTGRDRRPPSWQQAPRTGRPVPGNRARAVPTQYASSPTKAERFQRRASTARGAAAARERRRGEATSRELSRLNPRVLAARPQIRRDSRLAAGVLPLPLLPVIRWKLQLSRALVQVRAPPPVLNTPALLMSHPRGAARCGGPDAHGRCGLLDWRTGSSTWIGEGRAEHGLVQQGAGGEGRELHGAAACPTSNFNKLLDTLLPLVPNHA
eukprot:351309-Chlamydomonas_euryale.AAC.6